MRAADQAVLAQLSLRNAGIAVETIIVSTPNEYVVISTVQGQFVEAQIKAFLEAHDIPCQLRGETLRVTHGISIDGIGAAEVMVPAALANTARDLLSQAENGTLRIDESTIGTGGGS